MKTKKKAKSKANEGKFVTDIDHNQGGEVEIIGKGSESLSATLSKASSVSIHKLTSRERKAILGNINSKIIFGTPRSGKTEAHL